MAVKNDAMQGFSSRTVGERQYAKGVCRLIAKRP